MLFFFKQKTEYELRISDWSSDVCSSDLERDLVLAGDRRVRLDAGAFLQILLGEADGDLLLAAVDALDRLGRDEHPAPRQPVPGIDDEVADLPRSEERRVGNVCVRTVKSSWSQVNQKKKITNYIKD